MNLGLSYGNKIRKIDGFEPIVFIHNNINNLALITIQFYEYKPCLLISLNRTNLQFPQIN